MRASGHLKVSLMIDRMCGDFDRLPVALRKPWGFKDTVVLHSACGGFLHFMRLLREKVPATEFAKFEKTMTDQFMLGACFHWTRAFL